MTDEEILSKFPVDDLWLGRTEADIQEELDPSDTATASAKASAKASANANASDNASDNASVSVTNPLKKKQQQKRKQPKGSVPTTAAYKKRGKYTT
jgi:hypothetical protein